MAADLHITLGFIEPHLMLGYSGGRKLVAPGLAAQETIKVLHSPRFMRDARAVEGSIEDNPLHRELLEIARMARHDFMLDVALARDRSIAGVFAGHPEEAHREGVRFVSKVLLETLDQPVDAAISTAAGYPLDLTFYQAVKGVTAAAHVARPGAPILLAAACAEGAGAAEFRPCWKRATLTWNSSGASKALRSGGSVAVGEARADRHATSSVVVRAWTAGGMPAETVGHAPSRRSMRPWKRWRPAWSQRDHRGDSGRAVRSGEVRLFVDRARAAEAPVGQAIRRQRLGATRRGRQPNGLPRQPNARRPLPHRPDSATNTEPRE